MCRICFFNPEEISLLQQIVAVMVSLQTAVCRNILHRDAEKGTRFHTFKQPKTLLILYCWALSESGD